MRFFTNFFVALGAVANGLPSPNNDHEAAIVKQPDEQSLVAPETSSSIERRTLWAMDHVNCDYGHWVEQDIIREGNKYLRELNKGTAMCGAPAGRPGKGGCSRVSCSYGAGIWMCNDNDYHLEVKCSEVAEMTQKLTVNCNKIEGSVPKTRGQLFMKAKWNLIIDKC